MLKLKSEISDAGIIVKLRISVSQIREIAMRARGRAIPKPVGISAMIDTGADCTLLDGSVTLQLGLLPTGQTLLFSLETGKDVETLPVFDVDVVFVLDGGTSTRITTKVASKSLGETLPYKALLGRDLLRLCTLVYDGPENEFELTV